MAEMRHIDDAMSTYKSTSEVSKVNELAAQQAVAISPELFKLLTTALEYSRLTEGAFDITYASVGYGDVMLPGRWRLLAPLESIVGTLMVGVSVSLIFAIVTRLIGYGGRSAQE